jgi:rod shape-determining protein MreD
VKLLPYTLYLLLIALDQTILKDILAIYGVSINVTALLVLSVALYKSEVTAIWFGFAAGLIMAAGRSATIGWHVGLLAFIGVTAFHIRERLNLDSLYAKLLLIFGGTLLHNILVLLIDQTEGFIFLLWANAVPGAVYTSLVALVFFAVKERMVTYQKIREIF